MTTTPDFLTEGIEWVHFCAIKNFKDFLDNHERILVEPSDLSETLDLMAKYECWDLLLEFLDPFHLKNLDLKLPLLELLDKKIKILILEFNQVRVAVEEICNWVIQFNFGFIHIEPILDKYLTGPDALLKKLFSIKILWSNFSDKSEKINCLEKMCQLSELDFKSLEYGFYACSHLIRLNPVSIYAFEFTCRNLYRSEISKETHHLFELASIAKKNLLALESEPISCKLFLKYFYVLSKKTSQWRDCFWCLELLEKSEKSLSETERGLIHFARSKALMQAGQLEPAKLALEKAHSFHPNYLPIIEDQITLNFKLGNKDSAKKSLSLMQEKLSDPLLKELLQGILDKIPEG